MSISMKRCALAGLVMLCSLSVQADDLIDQARQDIDAGRYAQAYAALAAQERQRSGDPGFDLLLGIAAVETGRNTLGVFALERVLALQPDNLRARAEIARAYLALGETQGAKREFESVRERDVPPEVRATIDKLLAAMQRPPEGRRLISGYVEALVGHDSNVNSATSVSSFAAPGLGSLPFSLSSASRERSAMFMGISGGISARVPVNERWSVTGGANLFARGNGGATEFNTKGADGSVGLMWSEGKNTVSAGLALSTFDLDMDKLRDTFGLNLQWQHSYNARNQATAFVQHARIFYPQQDKRNVDRTVIGIGHAHVLVSEQAVLFASLYAGEEEAQARGFDQVGNHLWGTRVGAQLAPYRGWALFGSLAYESKHYRDDEPAFAKTRSDHQASMTLGANYEISPEWLVTPSVQLTRNHSNIVIYDYDRDVVQLAVRRKF